MSDRPVHPFTVGAFDCHVVRDGTFAYPHPARTLFAGAPADERAAALREHGVDPDGWEEYVSPYPCVVVETGEHTVLIDTGAGDLAPTTGNLRSNLETAGVAPADVDVVVLTHAHPDHVGGCLDGAGDPAFPDATYVLADREWEFWTGDADLSHLSLDDDLEALLRDVPRETLPALADRRRLVDADAETEVVPGVATVPAPGHTPGHMAVSVESGDERLLHLADTVLHPVHLAHPDWYTATDYDRDAVVETRRRLLSEAADEAPLAFVFHFPAPGLGRVAPADGAWEWRPRGTDD